MRSEELWLEDMLEHAREAVALAKGHNRDDLDSNRMLELALTRLLEIVGEAASQLPESTKARYEIPWKAIVGMRNILIHAYHRVDRDELWRLVTVRLPILLEELEGK